MKAIYLYCKFADSLIFKFTFSGSRKRKHKSHKKKSDCQSPEKDEDAIKHGGWWAVKKLEEINGPICIEFANQAYVRALDNGLFTLGAPHADGIVISIKLTVKKKNVFLIFYFVVCCLFLQEKVQLLKKFLQHLLLMREKFHLSQVMEST